VRLSGQFVSGEMISFAVSGGGGSMSVGGKIVKFCGSIVSALWQCVPLPMVGLKTRTMSTRRWLEESCVGPSYSRCRKRFRLDFAIR
jgi:hypothetical protein